MSTRRPAGAACAGLVVLSLLIGNEQAPASPREAGRADPVTIQVQGSPLGNLTTNGLVLTPAFSPAIKDYVLRCQAGANSVTVTLTAAPGGTIQAGSQSATQVSVTVTLVQDQALVVEAPDSAGAVSSYWIRCLPHDFPQIDVSEPGSPPPGWYLTGNLNAANGSGTYAMILDQNGTPVWYQKTAGQGAIDVTPLATNTLAWASNPGLGFGTDPRGSFSIYDLRAQTTRRLTTPTRPLDFHELLPLANGDNLLLASPLRAGVDLTALGLDANQTIVDCLIEEVNATGGLVWRWRASDHIRAGETLHAFPTTVNRQKAYDIYHCNSIDQDPSTGDALLSVHNDDAIYRIKRPSGSIVWKLGGNSVVTDGEQHLAVRGDPEQTFHGQHDARFQPDGDISLFDNHTWYIGAARGVEYHIDTKDGTASLVWQYQAPDGGHSSATGSFRRYANGQDNLVTWGIKPHSLFTELNAAGKVMLNATFPNGEAAYRTIKTPPSEFDLDLLHRSAGLPPAPVAPPAQVLSLGASHIGRSDGMTVNITGHGFTGATAVRFGSTDATSFSVTNDGSITASAPPGSGTAAVTVTTPGGTSNAVSQDMLAGSDSAFTTGTGSWKPNVNATLALTHATSRSGVYALELEPKKRGFFSALTGDYPVAGSAQLTGTAWAKAAHGTAAVRSALVFYDELGSVLWIEKGRFVRVGARWTRTTVTGTSPAGAATVALAVDNADGNAPLYLDDTALTGSDRFVYPQSALRVTSIGPNQGPGAGGTSITIAGGGFRSSTAVRFGSAPARSFTVNGDGSITAIAPPGSGTVDVTVTTPAGTSTVEAPNVLSRPDATFEDGPGSWIGNVNASVTSSNRARTGTYSLAVNSLQPDFDSVVSGAYPAAGAAVYDASLWVATPGSTEHVHPFMIFYGPGGEVLSIEQAPAFTKTAATGWKRLRLSARSPEGATSVAVGVDNADGAAELVLDDVELTSTVRFTYR